MHYLKRKLYFLFLLSILIPRLALSNMYGNKVNFSSGKDIDASGEYIGKEAINLNAKGALKGNGFLNAPCINIEVEKFEFTGTIECDQTCNIITRYPFDEKIFKRSGRGKFNISVIAPTEKKLSKEFKIKGSEFTFIGEENIKLANAIYNNNSKEVEKYLKENKELQKDKQLQAVFMLMAGVSDNVEITELFIKNGADVNGTDIDGQAHIVSAVNAKADNCIKALVKAGANPNVANDKGVPILVYAAATNNLTIVKTLLESPSIDVNITNRNKQTALMFAVDKGSTEITELLLNARANINAQDIYGNSAISIAKFKGYPLIVDLLEKKQ